MFQVSAPGIYTMSEADYHADCCPEPSLSRGIAQVLVRQTPMHAYHVHPRLGGNGGIVASKVMDHGSALHAMLLGKGADIELIRTVYGPKHKLAGKPVVDYKTDAAAEERDELRASGRIPVLPADMPDLLRCKGAVLRQINAHEDGADFLAPGQSEAVVVWQEDGLWFRIMIDRLPEERHAAPYDLKFTKMSVAPGGWERRLQTEYAFQDAFYRRGIKAVRGIMPPPMRFIVAELDQPHGVSIMACGPSLVDLAEREVERAIQKWRHCVKTDTWPGYPPYTAWVDATSWQITQADEAGMRDQILEDAI